MKGIHSYRTSGTQIDADKWNHFIANSPQKGIYALYEYLSIIRPDWEAIIVKENDEWRAVMPFCINKRWKYRSLPQPFLTQHWGVFMTSLNELPVRKSLSLKEAIISEIIPHFSDIDLFVQNFSPQFNYPLPFHWDEYELKIRYTYHLDLQRSEKELFSQMSSPLKRQIKKAQKQNFSISNCEDTEPLEQLFEINAQKGHQIVGDIGDNFKKISAIGRFLHQSGNGLIKQLKNTDGQVLAVSVFAFYEQKAIYMMGAYHPDFGNSGAASLLMWEGIKEGMMRNCLIFDFEGSMIKGVEHFFRKFGAHPVSYLQIYKNRLPLIVRWLQKLRS